MLLAQPMSGMLTGTGSTTGPGALATVALLAAPVTGTYSVTVNAGFGAGAPVAADAANMRLIKGAATVVAVLAVPAALAINAFLFLVELDGTQALTVQTIGAGTAGVVYQAGIYIYRVG